MFMTFSGALMSKWSIFMALFDCFICHTRNILLDFEGVLGVGGVKDKHYFKIGCPKNHI
jgi:hypothetical protein